MPVRGELLFQKEISPSADHMSDDLAGLKSRTAQVSDAQDQPGWLSCMYSCCPLDPSLPEMAWVSQFVPLLNVTTLDTSQYYLSLSLLRMSSLGLSRPSLSPRNSGNRATGAEVGAGAGAPILLPPALVTPSGTPTTFRRQCQPLGLHRRLPPVRLHPARTFKDSACCHFTQSWAGLSLAGHVGKTDLHSTRPGLWGHLCPDTPTKDCEAGCPSSRTSHNSLPLKLPEPLQHG